MTRLATMLLSCVFVVALAFSPGIVSAEPHRMGWYNASFGGTTVMLYGWRDDGGMIHWNRSQNPHVTREIEARLLVPPTPEPSATPKPPELTPMVGVTLDSTGTLNAGVDFSKFSNPARAGTLDTNDREFADRFFGDAVGQLPGTPPAGDDFVVRIGPQKRDPVVFLIPGALVIGAVILGLSGMAKRKGNP